MIFWHGFGQEKNVRLSVWSEDVMSKLDKLETSCTVILSLHWVFSAVSDCCIFVKVRPLKKGNKVCIDELLSRQRIECKTNSRFYCVLRSTSEWALTRVDDCSRIERCHFNCCSCPFRTDEWSRKLFPLAFVFFNIIYWSYYTKWSVVEHSFEHWNNCSGGGDGCGTVVVQSIPTPESTVQIDYRVCKINVELSLSTVLKRLK